MRTSSKTSFDSVALGTLNVPVMWWGKVALDRVGLLDAPATRDGLVWDFPGWPAALGRGEEEVGAVDGPAVCSSVAGLRDVFLDIMLESRL